MAADSFESQFGDGGAEGGDYLVSVSDLMVGLLFIFIIMITAFALIYRVATDKSQAYQRELDLKIETQQILNEAYEARLTKQQKLLLAAQAARRRAQDDIEAAEAARLLAEQRERDLLRKIKATQDETAKLADERDLYRQKSLKLNEEFAILERGQKILTENHKLRQSMLESLETALGTRGVAVTIDRDKGVLRLPESLLFDSGKAQLRLEGIDALNHLSQVLRRVLPCFTEQQSVLEPAKCNKGERPILEAIYIEGHTDNVPITRGTYESNWALSTARAVNTYSTLVGEDPVLGDLTNIGDIKIFGVSGYGEQRPVSSNGTARGRAKNRRIDIRFLLASPSAEEIDRIRRRYQQSRDAAADP